MISDPESLEFNIKAGIDGDIVSGLDFTLKLTGDTSQAVDGKTCN